jgi:hypothetical protein
MWIYIHFLCDCGFITQQTAFSYHKIYCSLINGAIWDLNNNSGHPDKAVCCFCKQLRDEAEEMKPPKFSDWGLVASLLLLSLTFIEFNVVLPSSAFKLLIFFKVMLVDCHWRE